MKLPQLLVALLLFFVLPIRATELPDLGDVSQVTLSPRQEKDLGLQIMAEIRAHKDYLDDAEITGYLTILGNKLILGSREARPDQDFEFFTVKDPAINAFALPGGYMGFNTGLILAAQAESELAGVMAHEIAHVTQKHLARMIAGQKYNMLVSLAAVALAVLASRTHPQISEAVLVGSQARHIQSQLDFTRDHEKEADRIGMNILVSAGFDPSGMVAFFEHLQKVGRFHENGAPSYLRTHPITYERIADIENRMQQTSYRQVPDSIDFQLVRAKVRPYLEKPADAVKYFDGALRDKRYTNEAVERYGLVNALLQDKKYARADKELVYLYEALTPRAFDQAVEGHRLGAAIRIQRKTSLSSPMIETLAARVKMSVNQTAEALDIYQAALKIYPQHRALVYDYADALLRTGSPDRALKFIGQQLMFTPEDTRLYSLQAQAYGAVGNQMSQHRAQAEVYARQGKLPAAIEQLEIALRTKDPDFYQASSVEARLRELRELAASKPKQK